MNRAMWHVVGAATGIVGLAAGSVFAEPPERQGASPPAEQTTSQTKPTDIRLWDPAYRLVGRFGIPFGETFRVEGFVAARTRGKGDDGTVLVVQRVNGKPSQEVVKVPVSPYFGSWGESPVPVVREGGTYAFDVYETGRFGGIPAAVLEKVPPIQTKGFGFETHLLVFGGEKRERIVDLPKEFVGKEAAFEGIARKGAGGPTVEGEGWTLAVDGEGWAGDVEGKRVLVRGLVRETSLGAFAIAPIEGGRELAKLEDLVGRRATLRGIASSMNAERLFRYREVRMVVSFVDEAAVKGWPHGDGVVITGEIVKTGGVFRVTNATWKPATILLPETGTYEAAQAAGERAMNEMEQEVAEAIERTVKQGFDTPEDASEMAVDLLEDDHDREELTEATVKVLPTVKKAREAEMRTWPARTDCDKLDAAFEELNTMGVMARHHWTCCGNCGVGAIDDEHQSLGGKWKTVALTGYTFYHQQDTESAAEDGGLYLNYGSTGEHATPQEHNEASVKVGRIVCDVLKKHGLATVWDGTIETRIRVEIDWKRRAKPARFYEGWTPGGGGILKKLWPW